MKIAAVVALCSEAVLRAEMRVGAELYARARFTITGHASRTEYALLCRFLRPNPTDVFYTTGDGRMLILASVAGMRNTDVLRVIDRESQLRDTLAELIRTETGASRKRASLLAMHALPTDLQVAFSAVVSIADLMNAGYQRLECDSAVQLVDIARGLFPRIMKENPK